jgi:hypothetical protein
MTAEHPSKKPDTDMRRFRLLRHEDESGTSGVGYVAEGIEFSDGSVMLHWFNEDNPDVETTRDGFSFKPGPDGVEDTIEVHGHGGRTEIEWIDDEPADRRLNSFQG